MESHEQAVQAISARVREFYSRKEKFRIYHGATNSTRTQHFERDKTVDTSSLNHVLRVDTAKRIASVEPNVGMGALVAHTLKYGLVPPVVMEFPGITVGGGFSGTSGESSSFKYGLFEQTICAFEIVLADGEVVVASSDTKEDLFYGAAGAFGTLGVITLLEVELIEAKPYVQLNLIPTASVQETVLGIEQAVEASPQKHDFVDGIVFSRDKGVVMIGHLTDEVPSSKRHISRFTRAKDEWFYLKCLESLAASGGATTVLTIPLQDYLFRYDRGAFWGAKYAFAYFWFPFTRFTRWVLDPFLHTKTMYHALHKSGLAEQFIIQDCVLPVSTVQSFIDYSIREFQFYPLWLCPIAKGPAFAKHPHAAAIKDNDPSKRRSWLLNVGIWGPGPRDHSRFIAVNREIERKVSDLGGVKTLYAHSYYTEDEFYEVYDRRQSDALRAKYRATSLPTVYEKVRVDLTRRRKIIDGLKSIRPLGGLYGVFCTILGRDYVFGRGDSGLVAVALVLALVGLLLSYLLPS